MDRDQNYLDWKYQYLSEIDLFELHALLRERGKSDEEINEMIHNMNQRLWVLCSPNREWFIRGSAQPTDFMPQSRMQCLYMVAWTFLNSFKGGTEGNGKPRKLQGGFVRDVIIFGKEPNDCDIYIAQDEKTPSQGRNHDSNSGSKSSEWRAALEEQLASDWPTCYADRQGLLRVRLINRVKFDKESKYAIWDSRLLSSFITVLPSERENPKPGYFWDKGPLLAIDGVPLGIPAFNKKGPGVSATMDNFVLTRFGIESKIKLTLPFPLITFSLAICLLQQFILFYEFTETSSFPRNPKTDDSFIKNNERRLKFEGRGITCLNKAQNSMRQNADDTRGVPFILQSGELRDGRRIEPGCIDWWTLSTYDERTMTWSTTQQAKDAFSRRSSPLQDNLCRFYGRNYQQLLEGVTGRSRVEDRRSATQYLTLKKRAQLNDQFLRLGERPWFEYRPGIAEAVGPAVAAAPPQFRPAVAAAPPQFRPPPAAVEQGANQRIIRATQEIEGLREAVKEAKQKFSADANRLNQLNSRNLNTREARQEIEAARQKAKDSEREINRLITNLERQEKDLQRIQQQEAVRGQAPPPPPPPPPPPQFRPPPPPQQFRPPPPQFRPPPPPAAEQEVLWFHPPAAAAAEPRFAREFRERQQAAALAAQGQFLSPNDPGQHPGGVIRKGGVIHKTPKRKKRKKHTKKHTKIQKRKKNSKTKKHKKNI